MPQQIIIRADGTIEIVETGPMGPPGVAQDAPLVTGTLYADVTFHPRETGGVYPMLEIDPIGDTAAWITAGGPAYFHLPSSGRVGINNMLDQTTSGVYDWNGSSFTRCLDANTTSKIHGHLLFSNIWNHHISGQPFTNAPQPFVAMLIADDPDLPLGEASWTGRSMVDFESLMLWTGPRPWNDPLLPEASAEPAWVDTTGFGGPDGPALSAARDLLGNVEWRGWTVFTAAGPPDPEADPPPENAGGFYTIAEGLPTWIRPAAGCTTLLMATTSNFFTGNIPNPTFAFITETGDLYVKPAVEGDHLVRISGSYRGQV